MPNQPPNPPSSHDSADWEAIARYFAGESAPDEREAVRRWLDAHPSEAAALASLDAASEQLAHSAPPELDVEAALRRVTERRESEDVVSIDSRRAVHVPAPARRWRTLALSLAAAAVLLVGVRLVWHPAESGGYTNPSVAAQTYATAVGERDSVRLPDGTRVVLAPESRLIVAAGYGDAVREVELRGEAYFDVPHDAARPFLVRAGDAAVRDLGTTFTVRAADDQRVRVVVTSGSVSLGRAQASGDSAAAVLQPGDAGTLGADGRTIVERGAASEPDTAWMRGRLVFREAPIALVRSELRRWYGIDLQVDSAFATRHLSMTFDGEPVDRVLQVIALSLGGEVERRGNTAVVKESPRAR